MFLYQMIYIHHRLFFALSLVFLAFMPLALKSQGVTPTSGLPIYPEWMYQARMIELNKATTIQLDYNKQVRAYIDVYTDKRRDHLSIILGRSKMYFPLFEEYLAKYNLPMELKYLAIVESALDPTAKSSSGAMGLWQFLFHASRMFDLNVDTYEDERCDPIKSTDAACRYLQYLYQNLNDWQLALAAYNGGLGVVQNAIERSGGKTNFWELQPFLPAPVQKYVPAFIAVNYAMNNYERHDIVEKPALITFDQVDTVCITKSLSFQQIISASGTTDALFRWLNPSYTKSFIPVYDKPVCIFLPKANIPAFVRAEKSLKNQEAPLAVANPVGSTEGRVKQYHIVGKGEFFHKIAIDYSCRISDIMFWNKKTKS